MPIPYQVRTVVCRVRGQQWPPIIDVLRRPRMRNIGILIKGLTHLFAAGHPANALTA